MKKINLVYDKKKVSAGAVLSADTMMMMTWR